MANDPSTEVNSISSRVLGSLIRRFLPDPLSTRPEPFLDDLSREEALALERLTGRLKFTLESLRDSPQSRTQLLESMSDLLTASTLSSVSREAAAKRLGARGALSPSLYKLAFEDEFEPFLDLGVRRSHVESAIQKPDATQYLLPELVDSGQFPGIALIVQRITPKRRRPYIFLVEADINDDNLFVTAAWNVPEQVALEAAATSPLEVLRSFTQAYGVLLELRGRPPAKLILHEAVPVAKGDQGPPLHPLVRPGMNLQLKLHVRRSSLNVWQIAIAYAIDIGLYKREVLAVIRD
jgi:hypothetical protein